FLSMIVLQWNINGFSSSFPSLSKILQDFQPSVLLLQEVRISRSPSINNFEIFHLPRPTRGGGLLAAFNLGSCISSVKLISSYMNSDLECQIFKINFSSTIFVTLIHVYCPKGASSLIHSLFFDDIMARFQNVLFCGDFNSRHSSWDAQLTNADGTALYNFIESHNLSIFNKKHVPTFSKAYLNTQTNNLENRSSTPDLVFGT